jgi:hypothetical protein
MSSITSKDSLNYHLPKRRLLGVVVAVGVLTIGAGALVVGRSGTDNTEAKRVQDAARVIRTDQWLLARNLDKNSSVDMMRALIMACDEIKTRGESC